MPSGLYRSAVRRLMLVASAAALVAACSSGDTTPTPSARIARPAFSEDEYGVQTSRRVAYGSGPVRKGGGHFKLGNPYKVAGRWYVPREDPYYDRVGIASWYGADFHGRRTSNGEVFDMRALSAAHPTMPLPSYAYVTNLDNGRTVMVRVNDRGPYVNDRIIDMSYAAARALGYVADGRARVRVRYAGRAPLNGDDRRERSFLAGQPGNGGEGYGVAAAEPGGPRLAMNSMPSYDVPDAGRWSPTAYRSALAGRPPPSYLGAPRPDAKTQSYLDAGLFHDRANAERMRHALRGLGPIEVRPQRAQSGITQFAVRLGPFAPGEAARARSAGAELGFGDLAIVAQ